MKSNQIKLMISSNKVKFLPNLTQLLFKLWNLINLISIKITYKDIKVNKKKEVDLKGRQKVKASKVEIRLLILSEAL